MVSNEVLLSLGGNLLLLLHAGIRIASEYARGLLSAGYLDRPPRGFYALRGSTLPGSAMRSTLSLALVLTVALAGCAHVPHGGSAASVSTLRKVSEAWNHSPSTLDADTVTRYYASDIIVMSPQGRAPVVGVDANREAWARFFSGVNPIHTMTTDTVIVGRADDLGYVTGQWTVGIDTPNGRMEAAGTYVAVWRKTGDEWRLAVVSAYPFR